MSSNWSPFKSITRSPAVVSLRLLNCSNSSSPSACSGATVVAQFSMPRYYNDSQSRRYRQHLRNLCNYLISLVAVGLPFLHWVSSSARVQAKTAEILWNRGSYDVPKLRHDYYSHNVFCGVRSQIPFSQGCALQITASTLLLYVAHKYNPPCTHMDSAHPLCPTKPSISRRSGRKTFPTNSQYLIVNNFRQKPNLLEARPAPLAKRERRSCSEVNLFLPTHLYEGNK
jgi:hypothetical protein